MKTTHSFCQPLEFLNFLIIIIIITLIDGIENSNDDDDACIEKYDDDGIEKYDDDDDKRPEEIAGQLILKSSLVVNDRHAG